MVKMGYKNRLNIPLVFLFALLAFILFLLCSCDANGSSLEMDSDTVDPVTLMLYGEEDVTVNYGSSYIDEGAYAIFNGEDCSDEIKIENHVDTSNLGNYTIEYSYKDKTIIRNVTVADTYPPAIELLGSNDVFLAVGDSYEEPGYTADDNYDGDITSLVKVESTLDDSSEI